MFFVFFLLLYQFFLLDLQLIKWMRLSESSNIRSYFGTLKNKKEPPRHTFTLGGFLLNINQL